jgi:hypothetical protein
LEQWKEIQGLEPYKFSNMGRVMGPRGLRKLKLRKNGYLSVNLSFSGKVKHCLVHRLVLEAFKGKSVLHVNHINGVKNDNRLENLEYCTPRENINHAVKNGLIKSGASHKLSKISHAQVLEIRNLLSEGLGSTEISRAMGISRYIVNDIKRGKTHKAVLT